VPIPPTIQPRTNFLGVTKHQTPAHWSFAPISAVLSAGQIGDYGFAEIRPVGEFAGARGLFGGCLPYVDK